MLTFDDGPFPETTPVILEILARFDAKATFFVVAEQAERYPDLVRRTVAEGHTIGLHGLRHEAMVLKSGPQIQRELKAATQILENILGAPLPTRLFRPPHGFKTWTLCRTMETMGWTLVGWSVDARDYDPLSSAQIVQQVQAGLQTRDIVLLHERPGQRETIEALPRILQGIAEQGRKTVAL